MTLPTRLYLPIAIPTIALADLVLLVALFFVLTTVHGADRAPVLLPEADPAVAAEFGSAFALVERRIDAGGRVEFAWSFSDGVSPSVSVDGPEGLFRPAAAVAGTDPHRTFVVKADAEANWAAVDRAVEILRSAGARNVVFWTRQPSGAPAP